MQRSEAVPGALHLQVSVRASFDAWFWGSWRDRPRPAGLAHCHTNERCGLAAPTIVTYGVRTYAHSGHDRRSWALRNSDATESHPDSKFFRNLVLLATPGPLTR
jgi:hypothetical protein